MQAPKKKPTEKLRRWRAALMRSCTHYLGVVAGTRSAMDEQIT